MISLYDILEASNGQLFGEPSAQIFTDFCLDAAQAGPEMLFIALRTDYGDGHAAIPEAVQNGASGVLCTRPPDCDTSNVSVVLVRDTEEALIAWAHYLLRKLGARVIAVTGASGKSIAVEAIGRILALRHPTHAALVEITGRLSIPLSLAKITAPPRYVVLKFSAAQIGELNVMFQTAQPEIGVIMYGDALPSDPSSAGDPDTSEHEALLKVLPKTGLLVLNNDSDPIRVLGTRTAAKVKTVGIDNFGADMMALNLVIGPDGTGFDLRVGSERHMGRWTPLLGKHHLYGVMAALTIGQHCDVPLEEAFKALTSLHPLPGRMSALAGLNDALLIDDSYSATPQSTLAALDWLSAIKAATGRTFLLLGDIDNLGTRSSFGHRSVGRRAAEVVDVLITQGKDAAYAARAALDHGMAAEHIHITYNEQDTLTLLHRHYTLSADDTLLIKGGPSARMELVTQALLKTPEDRVRLPRQNRQWSRVDFSQPARLTWVEIDTAALAANVRALKALVGTEVTLMAVVKSDAYGHGAVAVSRTALLNGASYLAVSSIAEALELRDAGIDAPILTLNYTPVYLIRQAIRQDITLTLYDLDLARAYNRAAAEISGRLKVHFKIDTGMGRLGALPDQTTTIFRHLTALRHLDIEGIYTHFSSADVDKDYTAQQLNQFRGIVRPLQATTGIRFRYTHAANSAAVLASKDTHLNLVRVGLAMYGLHPSDTLRLPEAFQPVMSWKTVVAQVKTLPAGHPVGYANTYVTQRAERIAVLPVGYGDGFRRAPQHWGEVLIQGRRAPILGRVSMEKTVISVDHIPEVSIGDEVVLLGRQGDQRITAEDIGQRLGTNNYEIVCSVLPRIARH